MEHNMAPTNAIIVSCGIIMANFLGVFGNVNIIWAVKRNKCFQSKHSLLIAITAFCHIICLLSELVNVFFILRPEPIIRSSCFPLVIQYILTIGMQAVYATMISIDLLVSVLFPVVHRTTPTVPYVLVLSIPPLVYGIFLTGWGFLTINDDVIPFCNPPLALSSQVSLFWGKSNVIVNTFTLLLYVILMSSVYRQARKRNAKIAASGQKKKQKLTEEEKIFRSISVVVIVFFCTWYICLLGVDAAVWIGLPKEWIPYVQSNMVFPALLCYSQTYFVLFWRGLEYRRAFTEQFSILTFGWIEEPQLPTVLTTHHSIVHSNNTKTANRIKESDES